MLPDCSFAIAIDIHTATLYFHHHPFYNIVSTATNITSTTTKVTLSHPLAQPPAVLLFQHLNPDYTTALCPPFLQSYTSWRHPNGGTRESDRGGIRRRRVIN